MVIGDFYSKIIGIVYVRVSGIRKNLIYKKHRIKADFGSVVQYYMT